MVNFIMNNENLIFMEDENSIMVSPYKDGNILFYSDKPDSFIIFSSNSDNYLEQKTYMILFETMEKVMGRFLLTGEKNKKLASDFVDINDKSIKITSLYKNASIELLYGDKCIALSIHKEVLDSRKDVTLVTDGLKYYEYSDIFTQMIEDLLNTVYSYNIDTSIPVLKKEYLS